MSPRFGKVLTISTFLLLLSVPFQNCSQRDFNHQSSDDKNVKLRAGNGEGYEGKVSRLYMAYDPSSQCELSADNKAQPNSVIEVVNDQAELSADNKAQPNSVIEVVNDQAFITRQNCQDLSSPVPTDKSALIHESYQDKVFAFEGQIFEEQKTGVSNYVELFCSGSQFSANGTEISLTAIVRSNELWSNGMSPELSAEIYVGERAASTNDFVLKLATSEFSVEKFHEADGFNYSGSLSPALSGFNLKLIQPALLTAEGRLVASSRLELENGEVVNPVLGCHFWPGLFNSNNKLQEDLQVLYYNRALLSRATANKRGVILGLNEEDAAKLEQIVLTKDYMSAEVELLNSYLQASIDRTCAPEAVPDIKLALEYASVWSKSIGFLLMSDRYMDPNTQYIFASPAEFLVDAYQHLDAFKAEYQALVLDHCDHLSQEYGLVLQGYGLY